MKTLAQLLLTEQDLTPKYTLYCDLDGVLTNFEGRFLQMLRQEGTKYYPKRDLEHITRPKHFEAKFGQDEMWLFINGLGEEFWSGMEWMPNGKQLWDFIQPYNPQLLTSPSRDNSSRLGKIQWVNTHIAQPVKVHFRFGAAKSDFANENAILIDDRPSNLKAFSAAGGIAIECKDGNIQTVIQQLRDLGYGTRELIAKGL